MVKQDNPVSWKRLVYVAFAIMIMMMSWESTKMQASALIRQDIPQESIRIRILANSDSVADQWVKREVRDALVDEIRTWADGPQTIEEARDMIRARLAELERLAAVTVRDRGFAYDVKVELDTVTFPEKNVGFKVYPAGQYEALRLTLGKGEGQNWWCVLFPPLCFMGGQIVSKKSVEAKEAAAAEKKADAGKGKPAESKPAAAGKAASETGAAKKAGAPASTKAAAKTDAAEETVRASEPQPEIRFFVWDMLKKLFA